MAYPESLRIAGCRLERWDAARDLAALRVIAADEDVQRFVPLATDEAALAGVSERFAGHWVQCGFGLWAVRPDEGPGAGWVGACHPRWHPEFELRIELAWSLTGSLRGRGLATAAARAAAEACFDDLDRDEVIAFVDPVNTASLAVTRRLGMRRAGSTAHPATGAPLHVFALARPRA